MLWEWVLNPHKNNCGEWREEIDRLRRTDEETRDKRKGKGEWKERWGWGVCVTDGQNGMMVGRRCVHNWGYFKCTSSPCWSDMQLFLKVLWMGSCCYFLYYIHNQKGCININSMLWCELLLNMSATTLVAKWFERAIMGIERVRENLNESGS